MLLIEASRLLAFDHLTETKSNRTNEPRPSMCRGCGAIVGAGETSCAVCGASTINSNAPPRKVSDRETMRFARAVLGRPYKFTIILLVANFFVFLLMWQSSGMTISVLGVFPPEVLIAYGAKLNALINEGQWWRLVTPMFVHVNLLHLLVNMYSLWIVGPYVEKLYGSAKFLVIWVVSGLGASLASYLTVVDPGTPLGPLGRFLFRPDGPSAGASGALFGMVGVLFVFGIKYRDELPEGFKRAFGTGLLPMILLNLFIGYMGRGLFDNAAHLGGLVTGAALALVVGYRRPGERTGVAITWQILRVGALTLVAVSFLKAAQHFREPLPLSVKERTVLNSGGTDAAFLVFAKTMNTAQETFYRAMQGDSNGVDDARKSLESVPHFDQESAQLMERLKALLSNAQEFKRTPASSPASDPRKLLQEEQALLEDFGSWSKDYNRWLKTTGKTYGGLIDEPTPQTLNNSTQ
ncbi:MAG: rhomboid family intramembrane serine protease [Pyrinomonadaceae bacterium]|nr:rhomboid family intramembrane serine protease [Pyrinomonadaceae bacterium]